MKISPNKNLYLPNRGITLLEVLIALAIISIALISAWLALGLSANNYTKVQDNILASIIAKNILTEMVLSKGVKRLDRYICQPNLPYQCQVQIKKTPNKYLYSAQILIYKNDNRLITSLSTIMPYNND